MLNRAFFKDDENLWGFIMMVLTLGIAILLYTQLRAAEERAEKRKRALQYAFPSYEGDNQTNKTNKTK